jgi:hypothetical protein
VESDKTNEKLHLGSRAEKLYSENTLFCVDFTKSIILRSLSLGQITRKCE